MNCVILDERYLGARNSKQLQPKLPLVLPAEDEAKSYITAHPSEVEFSSAICDPGGLYMFEQFHKRKNHGSLVELDFVDACMDFRFATSPRDRLSRAVDIWNLYLRDPRRTPIPYAGARRPPVKQWSSRIFRSQRSMRVIPQEPSKVRVTRAENIKLALQFQGAEVLPSSIAGETANRHSVLGFLPGIGKISSLSSNLSSSRSSILGDDELYKRIERKILSEISMFVSSLRGEYNGSGSFRGHPPPIFARVFADCVNNIGLAGTHFLKSKEYVSYVQIKLASRVYAKEDDFQTLRILGKGSFAEVNAELKRDTGKLFAVKALSKRQIKNTGLQACCWIEHEALSKGKRPPSMGEWKHR